MDRNEARKRIEELRRTLEENSRRYYVDNAPVISDFEFDTLMHELEGLEAEYPEFDSPDSPTRKVGSDLDAPLDGNAEPQARTGFVQRRQSRKSRSSPPEPKGRWTAPGSATAAN